MFLPAIVVRLILTPRNSNTFSCRYRVSPSALINCGGFRFFADWAFICGCDIGDTFQFRSGILDFGQGIHLHTTDWKIGKYFGVTRFGLTFFFLPLFGSINFISFRITGIYQKSRKKRIQSKLSLVTMMVDNL